MPWQTARPEGSFLLRFFALSLSERRNVHAAVYPRSHLCLPGRRAVFEHLNLNLDTGWRLGVIGRNGRGKTTLLRLMMGRMPFEGAIDLPLEAVYFPYEVSDASLPALEVLRRAAPGAEEWRILREWKLLGVTEEALDRPFGTLSKGEQTKARSARCLRGRTPIL